MAFKTVWGLDIGNSAIKAVKMTRSGAEARIVDFDIIDIQPSDDEADRPSRVQAALNTLCTNHHFGRDAVFLSLSGDMCLFREFQLPPGSESKLNDLVLYEAKQQIPFPLDQVYMGWEKYDDPSGAGVGVEMIVVRKNIVHDLLQLTDQFHLNVQGITVAPVALFNFVSYEYQPAGPVLILDAGYKSTDFVVMNGRHMYSRTIQIAGREITRILENKFKVGYDRAEELKKNISQSKQADKILSVIEPTLRQLGAEIQRTIGFYKSKARGQKISQGYLLGHTFRLPRMAETMASQVREAPFTVVEGVRRLVLDRAVNPGVFANEFPTMAVALGLGLQGLGMSELTVNLLPPERKTTNRLERVKLPAALAAAAILIALVVSYVQADSAVQEQTRLKKEIETVLALKDQFKTDIQKLEAPIPPQVEQVKALAQVGKDRGRLVQIYAKMAGLKDATGQDFWGPHNETYLTNIYVSRYPFGSETALSAGSADDRMSSVSQSRQLTDANGLYGALKKAKEEKKQPELPLMVVLSGECKDQGKLSQIVQALEQQFTDEVGEISKLQVSAIEMKQVAHDEAQANLEADGSTVMGQPIHGQPVKSNYTAFHIVFSWNPAAQAADGMAMAK